MSVPTNQLDAAIFRQKRAASSFDCDCHMKHVRPLHSSTEAGEQTWATGGGAGGAKGEDRGEHGRATHMPDTAPGKRVPEARMCTRSCSWDSSLTTRGESPV